MENLSDGELGRQLAEYDWKNFNCQTCGACCQHYKTLEVSARDENYQWLKDNGYLKADEYDFYEAKTGSQKPERHIMQMKTEGNFGRRCAALVGEIGVGVSCSIYDKRPNACRTYEAETSRCRTARFVQIQRELGVEWPKPIYTPEQQKRRQELENEIIAGL